MPEPTACVQAWPWAPVALRLCYRLRRLGQLAAHELDRQRLHTQCSSVCPTAVHSRDRLPTTGFSLGSKAYIDHRR